MEQDGDSSAAKSRLSGLLWHGGSAYDAWFSCASNQVSIIHSFPCDVDSCILPFCAVLECSLRIWPCGWLHSVRDQVAQVLLTLPYSFSQLGMLSGILFQLFYGLMGSWTAYLISILYLEYRTRKEREKADFRNHVIQVGEDRCLPP
jgi:auxin influx carrier (AUX1 LAX family)